MALTRLPVAEGRGDEAAELLRRAFDIASETRSIRFAGPIILGSLARALAPADERQRALVEAEAIIHSGCVGHNQLRFYPEAMDVSLQLEDYDEAERYAAALEGFTCSEPLPWADFFAARGRALAAFGRGRCDPALGRELARLREEGERLGLLLALPTIQAALADAAREGRTAGANNSPR
ncbi:MAG TPA: hypothetical protein VEX11_17155 [Acetobacteraceae bacterium]|nr:hypothetical protein [Acetobacteraceae bacterium]